MAISEQILHKSPSFIIVTMDLGNQNATIDHVSELKVCEWGNVSFLSLTCTPPNMPYEQYKLNLDDIESFSWKAQTEEYTEKRRIAKEEADKAAQNQQANPGPRVAVVSLNEVFAHLNKGGN